MPRAQRQAGAGGDVTFDVKVQDGATITDLAAIVRGLDKEMATAVRKRVRNGISDAGQELSAAVREQAATWSSRIPSTVKVQTSFGARSAGATITAGGKRAPHARPLEFGNKNTPPEGHHSINHRVRREVKKGNLTLGRALRHPVFGRPGQTSDEWTWADMPTRPFFFAAVKARTPDIDARMLKVVDEVARDLGFTGT